MWDTDGQITMFEELPDLMDADAAEVREVLRRGSGFEGGCLRIYAAERLLDPERFVEFLKDEFGTGGHSITGGFCNYNGRKLTIEHWKQGNKRKEYTWKNIAYIYREMISIGSWPDAEVKELYAEARKAGKGAPAPRLHYYRRGEKTI